LFSNTVEQYIAPKKGRCHVLRVIRELLFHQPQGRGTSIQTALDFLLKVAKRRSVVFLISDYIDEGFLTTLRVVNRKHDLIGLQLYDPAEIDIPDIGLVKVHDPETEQEFWIDTSVSRERMDYSQVVKKRFERLKKECDKIKFDLIQISTGEDYINPLMSYFKQRERRY